MAKPDEILSIHKNFLIKNVLGTDLKQIKDVCLIFRLRTCASAPECTRVRSGIHSHPGTNSP